MLLKTENLLREAGRRWESLVGWVCALISGTFATGLVWLGYLVAWRNPREYGVNDLYKVSTLLIFLVLLAIAVGFSVIAVRLINSNRRRTTLMSPIVLRIWGSFFALTSIALLIDALVRRKWIEVPHCLTILTTTGSLAIASFALAKRRKGSMPPGNSGSQGSATNGEPFRSEINRQSSATDSRR